MTVKLSILEITLWCLSYLYLTSAITLEDYCKFGKENTPCKYRCRYAKDCVHLEPYKDLTDREREVVLHKHNVLRNEVAGGKYEKQFLPKAKVMYALSYDKEVEFFASCYIKQCIWEHDHKRVVERFKLGQNLYQIYANHTKGIPSGDTFLNLGIQEWFDEIEYVNEKNYMQLFENFHSIKNAGHLSAMLWWHIKYVGCCKYHFMNDSVYYWHLFCDYGPPGNISPRSMYERGEPDCKSVNSVPNERYPNLCGTQRPMSEDTYVPPKLEDDVRDDIIIPIGRRRKLKSFAGKSHSCLKTVLIIVIIALHFKLSL